ncbi:MAG: PstS family phosphate ABC transporter substrate-binding protein [Leptolyngbyaceae cyanobacterium SM1_1_3]|nr:PstS family phosphate ABC transporter substrate-binding protein [Leptolyngbyaceae cyanobacterium SM1_1_3]NJN03331.1 PstS family phosphate ABC transporter substrate-binding protein [Leptolyngbyaceae cyanobacterium RM1_1_2]NJO11299.1 PstS family phosphate ABC transporter substrate-binding protein [Leptolyngbyaceae cyanobacterium SL_1_1]
MTTKNETPALITALVITVGLVGGGLWWLNRSGTLDLSKLAQQPQDSTQTSAPSLPKAVDDFASVSDVPQGLFNYGGSTTWAPIRSTVDSEIETVWPDFELRYVNPTAKPPSSGVGIAMLLNGQLSFAQSSRSLRTEEYEQAQQQGFSLQEIPVAIEGIAIAVHPDLQIPDLTLDQLKDIYTGQSTNWQQVGGPDLPITPYSRSTEGGTVDYFIDAILGGENLGSVVQFVDDTTLALREVSNNPGAIYYASAPEVVGQCTVRPLPVRRVDDELVAPYVEPFVPLENCPDQRNQPNTEAFRSGQYPITRRLFVVVKQNGQSDQQAGETYAQLLLSNQGQALLSQAGFVQVR